MSAPAPSSTLPRLSLALHLVSLGGIAWLAFGERREPAAEESSLPAELEDLTDEIVSARLEMKRSAERFEALVSRLSTRDSSDANVASPGAIDGRPLADLSNDELFDRWQHVCRVHSEHQWNPLTREPVEKERAAIEAEMRARGDAQIQTIAARFRTVEDHWLKTRLLTHVVEPLGSPAGYDFAYSIFGDPAFNSGLRLYAAQVAMKDAGRREEIMGELIDLLEHPDATFTRREEIVNFLKSSPDARALPVLQRLASAPDTEQNLRTFAIQALGSLHGAECVTILQDLAQTATLGNLRIEALRSLHKIQGKEILPFLRGMRDRIGPEDQQLQIFVDNIEQLYQG